LIQNQFIIEKKAGYFGELLPRWSIGDKGKGCFPFESGDEDFHGSDCSVFRRGGFNYCDGDKKEGIRKNI
jgi:hypothetical protein